MRQFLLIAAGGALGAVLRFVVASLASRLAGDAPFPFGTLVVNVSGAFVIGLLAGLAERAPLPPAVGPLVVIGILGAYTTFSTYALESVNLIRAGEFGLGLLNLLASNALALLVVYLGFACARLLPSSGG